MSSLNILVSSLCSTTPSNAQPLWALVTSCLMAVRKPWGLKKPVIQNTLGLPWKHQLWNWAFLSSSSVNQNPIVEESHDTYIWECSYLQVKIKWHLTFCHNGGTFASYIESRAALRFFLKKFIKFYLPHSTIVLLTSLIMIVPSMANLRSCRVERTTDITLCIRSISCLKNMFIGARAPIAFSLART